MIIKYSALAICISSSLLLNTFTINAQQSHIDEFGNTELHYAMRRCVTAYPQVRSKHIDEICTLLFTNASFTKKNNRGWTASQFAAHQDTSGGYGIPLTDAEEQLFRYGKFSVLYGEWLEKNQPKKLNAWQSSYLLSISGDAESISYTTRHKKASSDDNICLSTEKRLGSLPVMSNTASVTYGMPAIVISYDN